VTTLNDPEHRPTVVDLLAESHAKQGKMPGVASVSRWAVDYNSEGLLLLTNDGDLANSLSKAV